MDEADRVIRNATYRLFVELGRSPTVSDVSRAMSAPEAEVEASWRRLHDMHALVLEPGNAAIRMANPFSATPTAFRVNARGRWWYGNCAWDAIGICAALHADGRIESACPDCEDPIAFEVVDGQPSDMGLLFHCLVPAVSWWDDIVFT